MIECAICKDPIDPNGNYPLTKSGLVHFDCQKNLELASLKAKVKELEASNNKLKNGIKVLDEIIRGYIGSEEELEDKVKDLEEQLESIYSVSKPHTCRGNDHDNVGYWRCILCGAKYELTKKEKDV